jgi:DNA polymerase-3 subunit gamma/tau
VSYQVLARKWRPRNFQELVGQEHVVRALVNGLDHGRLHHAFLFTGTRGVGKTTIARVLAKALNCEQGVTSSPCGACAACVEIDEGRFVDLIEVDAASRTKVEDTRELLENVQYAPTRGRYKVYLIDEVHMLSGHSFNALLKTLEEPPPHVKFLLATTDPQRLPVTILSRCLQFNLKRLPAGLIAQHLGALLDKEGIPWEAPALAPIARAGNGSMRDALSLLDQAIAFGDGRIELHDVSDMLGTIDQRHVLRLVDALARNDAEGLLNGVAELEEMAPDYSTVLAELLSLLQSIALAQVVPDQPFSDDVDPNEIRRLSQVLAPEDVQLFYQIALIGRRDLPLAPEPRGGLEMILLRMLCFRPVTTDSDSPRRAAPPGGEGGDDRPKALAPHSSVTAEVVEPEPKPPVGVSSGNDRSAALSAFPALTPERWKTTVESLGLKGLAQQLALNCVPQGQDGDTLCLMLDPGCAQTRTKNGEERLRTALEVYFGRSLSLRIEVAVPASATPARQQAQLQEERRQAAEQIIEQDPNVRTLCETFDACVRPGSVTPAD